jgi:hypothetical protein
VTNGSLIAGKLPSSSSGNFNMEPFMGTRNVKSLTDGGSLAITTGGSPVTTSSNYVTCGNGNGAGASVTYTLTGSSTGYDLTNIVVYGGWGDNGRDQQAYTVYYATVSAPTNFLALARVNFNPSIAGNLQSATRVAITSSTGLLASAVAAVKFDFTSPTSENGYCGYSELTLFGLPTPVVVPVATNPTNITAQLLSAGTLKLSWPSDHTGWRLQRQTNSLAQGLGTNWVDVAGATTTNALILPVNPASGSVFYRMINP